MISSFLLPQKRSRAATRLGTYMPSTALKFQHFRHNESNNTSDHVSIGDSTNPNVLSYAGYEQLLLQSLTIQLAYWARSALLQDPLVSNAGIIAPKKCRRCTAEGRALLHCPQLVELLLCGLDLSAHSVELRAQARQLVLARHRRLRRRQVVDRGPKTAANAEAHHIDVRFEAVAWLSAPPPRTCRGADKAGASKRCGVMRRAWGSKPTNKAGTSAPLCGRRPRVPEPPTEGNAAKGKLQQIGILDSSKDTRGVTHKCKSGLQILRCAESPGAGSSQACCGSNITKAACTPSNDTSKCTELLSCSQNLPAEKYTKIEMKLY